MNISAINSGCQIEAPIEENLDEVTEKTNCLAQKTLKNVFPRLVSGSTQQREWPRTYSTPPTT